MEINFGVKQAIVLAAGFGTRMKPITDTVPKPMIQIGERSMIERVLDRLILCGIKNIVVNTRYKADLIEDHLSKYKYIEGVSLEFSRESTDFNTGGGVLEALRKGKLKHEPFLIVNSDIVLFDSHNVDNIQNLLTLFGHLEECQILLSHQPGSEIQGYDGGNLFRFNKTTFQGHRFKEMNGDSTYIGLGIINPTIFREAIESSRIAFPLSEIIELASISGTLFGYKFDGIVFHIDTPTKLEVLSKEILKIEQTNEKVKTSSKISERGESL